MAESVRAGTGYIDILPRFGPQWSSALENGVRQSAQRAGSQLEQGIGTSSKIVENHLGQLSRVMASMVGATSPLGSAFQGVFNSIQSGFDKAATKAEEGRRRIGAALEGIGVAALALGALFEHFAGPLEKSMADATVAIRNAGKPVDEYRTRFEEAAKGMANFGFRSSDTVAALAKLTVSTKSPDEALKELNFTSTLAAAKHISLSEAATLVGRAHSGVFRAFKEYGINVTAVTNADAKAEAATKSHAAALDSLHTAQENLANFEARIAEQRAAAQAAYQQRLEAANQRVADSEQNLTDLEARLADQQLQAREAYVQKVEAANDRVIASEQSLADAKRAAAASSESADQSLADALQRLNDLRAVNAVEGDPKLQAEMRRQQEVRNAEQSVTRARERAAETRTSGAESVARADDSVAQARAAQAKTVADVPTVSLAQQQELARAAESISKAKDALADVVAKGPGGPGLAAAQEEQKLREAAAKAQEKETETAAKEAKAKQDAADSTAAFNKVETEFMAKEKGLLEERRKTWAGTLDALKAKVEDFFAHWGERLAKPLTEFAPAAILGGALLRTGRGARGAGSAAGGIGGAARAAGGALQGAPEDVSFVADAVGGAGAAGGEAAAGGGLLAGLLPAVGIAAGVAALGAALYLAYEKIKPFHDAVDKVGRALKIAFVDTVDFVREHWRGLLEVLAIGFGPIGALGVIVVKFWKEISGAAEVAWRDVIKPVFGFLENVAKVILPVAFTVLKDAVKIAWGLIQAYIEVPYKTVIHPIFTGISAAIRDVVGPAFSWLGDKVIGPVFGFFKQVVSDNWGAVKAVFEEIDRHIRGPLTTAFHVISDVWSAVWDTVKSIVTSAVRDMVGVIGKILGAIATVAEWIPGAGGLGKALRSAQHDLDALVNKDSANTGSTAQGPNSAGRLAGGGVMAAAPGFRTKGPQAVVGEGDPRYPEYVIATDPKYRLRNLGLFSELAGALAVAPRATGGLLATRPFDVADIVGSSSSLGGASRAPAPATGMDYDRLVAAFRSAMDGMVVVLDNGALVGRLVDRHMKTQELAHR